MAECTSIESGNWPAGPTWTPSVPTAAGGDNATVNGGHVVTDSDGSADCIDLAIAAAGEVDAANVLAVVGDAAIAGELGGAGLVYAGGSLVATGSGIIDLVALLMIVGMSAGDFTVDLNGATVGDVQIAGSELSRTLAGVFRCGHLAICGKLDLGGFDLYCDAWKEYNGCQIDGDGGDISCAGDIYHQTGDAPVHVSPTGRLVGSGPSNSIEWNTALMAGLNLTLASASDYAMSSHVRLRSLWMEGTASLHGAYSLILYPIEDDHWNVPATAGLAVTGFSISSEFLYLDQTGANPPDPRAELPNITNSTEVKPPADFACVSVAFKSFDKTSYATYVAGIDLSASCDMWFMAATLDAAVVGGAVVGSHLICKDVQFGRDHVTYPNISGWTKLVDAVVVAAAVYALDQAGTRDLGNEVEAENTLFNIPAFNGNNVALNFSKGCRVAGELTDCTFGAGVRVQAWGAADGGGNSGEIEWQPRQVGGIMPLAVA